MKILSLVVLLFSMASTQAAVNGPCTGGGLASGTGVCISTSKCTASGGTVHNGLCPDDPNDIKCCTKAPCTSASLGGGVCRFTSSCTGNHYTISNLCPGPTDFKCCAPCAAGKRDEESSELDKRLPVC
ncbi:Glycoside hydrolase family 24 protein [Mycena venus]|uniref:Glycoside hydrolase family 24 protein n=1 Tax=Mycena venus TaxID=2733690 RepID=A0A8H6Y596_9AGAR|nr:Glycoside hydrolase family 24 protein [Mycena venus]